MKNKLIEEHELPKIFQNIIDMFVKSGEDENSLDFWEYSSNDFYGSPCCLWLGDIFSIVLENGKLGISFNMDTPAVLAANLIQFFMRNNYDLEIYESFYYHNGELSWEDENGKLYFNTSLN